jgi:hypothetical protein
MSLPVKTIEHWVGQRVRNKTRGWIGRVAVVECSVCAKPMSQDILTCPHNTYCLTIDQGGFLKPWCLSKDYEDATIRLTAWERILEGSAPFEELGSQ